LCDFGLLTPKESKRCISVTGGGVRLPRLTWQAFHPAKFLCALYAADARPARALPIAGTINASGAAGNVDRCSRCGPNW
jgi:hypothetical protein